MKKDGSSESKTRAPGLRELAERQVALTESEVSAMPPDSLKALVHELQVHQVELDLQNDELRRVQFDLAEARDRYLDLFEFAPVAYLTLNAQQVVENANLTAAAMFATDRGKLAGQKLARFAVKECRDACHRSIQSALDSSSKQVCEMSFLHGDAPFVGRMEIVPMASPCARAAGVRVTVTDITARKRAEEAMAEAKHAAEAANSAKSRFLAMMSHELRTPMSAILGMSELALAEPLSPTVREYIATLKGSADNLLSLLNELLDFSRIEAGNFTLEAAPFRLRHMLAGVVESLDIQARQKGLKLTCEILDDVPDGVVGDSHRLRQILLNLVDNAVKFASHGDVAVRVIVRTRSNDEVRLQFSVSDSGIGIAPDRLKDIFDPFTQADTSTTRRYGGSGLGLAIAANLVALMDGRIWIESKVDEGSTFLFSVRLPLAREPVDESRPAVEPPRLATPTRPLRILLAEDTRSSQQVIAAILRKRGHTVALADDGQTALDLATQNDFDVIVMDVQMPGLDGLQATAAIRALPQKDGRRAPIIALTAHAYRDDAARCAAAGMDAFLSKPVHSEELIDLVERLAETTGCLPALDDNSKTTHDAAVPAARPDETPAPQDSLTNESPPSPHFPTDASGSSDVFSYGDALEGCLNNPELLKDIIQCFFDDVDPLMQQAREALDCADAEKMGQAVHRLKGTVLHLAAPAAKEALHRVERIGYSSDLTDAEAAVNDAQTQIDLLKRALAAHRRKADNLQRSMMHTTNMET